MGDYFGRVVASCTVLLYTYSLLHQQVRVMGKEAAPFEMIDNFHWIRKILLFSLLVSASDSFLGFRLRCQCSKPNGLIVSKIASNRIDRFEQSLQNRSTSSDIRVSKNRLKDSQVFKLFQRAQTLIRNGNNFGAQKLLNTCIEMSPDDSHSWLALARLEAKIGNIERSREIFSQSVIPCPRNVHILHAWGHMEQKHGNVAMARDCWSKALEIDPLNAYVCHALSTLELRLRNYDRARELLREIVEKQPTAQLCVSLAELELQLGDSEAARRILQNGILNCTTDRSKLFMSLAWIEEDTFGNKELAGSLIDKALEEDASNIRLYLCKANMLLRKGLVHEARELLRSSTGLDSIDAKHYTMWSTIEVECRNFTAAREVLSKGAELFPGDHFLLQRWGTVEAKLGNFGKARELFEQSVMIQPHAPTFVAWATMEEKEALEVLRSTAAGDPALNIFEKSAPVSIPDLAHLAQLAEQGVVESILELNSPSLLLPDVLSFDSELPIEIDSEEQVNSTASESSDMVLETILESSAPNIAELWKNRYIMPLLDDIVDADSTAGKLSGAQTPAQNQDLDAEASLRKTLVKDTGENLQQQLDLRGSEAKKLYVAGKLSKARLLFTKGMQIDPQHGPVYHAYGFMEMRHGNLTGARGIFQRGIFNNCTDLPTLYHAWGILEMRANDMILAADLLRRGIDIGLKMRREDIGVDFIFHSLGMLELHRFRPEEALRIFIAGNKLYPAHSQLLLGLALSYMRLGDYDRAREHFRASVDADQSHVHAWQSWALAEKQYGNIELARILFRQGLKNGPNHGPLWQGFAVMEMQQGNLDIARTLFRQAVKQAPDHAQSFQAWSCLEVKTGNMQCARDIAWKAIRKFPNHPALWTVVGQIEWKLGNIEYAREIFKISLKRFHTHGPLYRTYGELESRIGMYERAAEIFKLGIANDPYHAPIYHSAALLSARLGNLDELSRLHKIAQAHFQHDLPAVVEPASSAGGVKASVEELTRFLDFLPRDSEGLNMSVQR